MISIIHYENTNSVEVTWRDQDGNQLRCHSYADVQMDMLRDDLGEAVSEHEELIAHVIANIKPAAKPSKAKRIAELTAEYKTDISNIQMSWVSAGFMGDEDAKSDAVQEAAERKAQYQADIKAVKSEA